ncbi:CDP-diacylglycerol--inositol 3-phosphatidyltransferase 1 [Chlorella vulgaris]
MLCIAESPRRAPKLGRQHCGGGIQQLPQQWNDHNHSRRRIRCIKIQIKGSSHCPNARSCLQVLLLPPNLVGHLRLLLAHVAATASSAGHGSLALSCFSCSLALDAADGWLARRFNCSTSFGALYDVVIDNLTRAMLWSAAGGPWAGLPIALEGITLACTHAGGGAAWKSGGCFRCEGGGASEAAAVAELSCRQQAACEHGLSIQDAPRWVQLVMGNGFRSPLGVLAIAGLSGCPLWLFARSCLRPGTWLTTPAWALVLVPGRLLAAAVECWVVQRRMQQLTQQDAAAHQRLKPS